MTYLGTSTLKGSEIVNGKVVTVSGIDNITNQIKNILDEDGVILGNYGYGAFLGQFKNMRNNNATGVLIRQHIQKTLRNNIPSIDSLSVEFLNITDSDAIQFNVIFTVKQSYERGMLVYPFYLNEA